MKRDNRKLRPTTSSEAARSKHTRRISLEWPLLAFPVAVLIALGVLYLVDRSMKRETAARTARRFVEANTAAVPAPGEPVATTSPAGEAVTPQLPPESQPQDVTPRAGTTPVVTQETPGAARFVPPVQQRSKPGNPWDGLQGADRTIAILQDAIRQSDDARIKQCLDELVALGDRAIAPLTRLIANEGGDAGLWAAEALARIGSPVATTTLLDTLSQIKEGPYKEELGRRIAGISNHESWPVLLNQILETADATVLRAAASSLARMADTPVVDELIARYEGTTEARDIERIAQLISSINSSRATEALIALAGDVASAPQNALEQAAVEALGKIGDPEAISYLLRKLEASPPGEGDYLFNTISQVNQPQGYDALLSAAAGNKEVSANNGRVAAIYALRNYPDSRTIALLEQIVAEENERVVSAAARTLDDIRRTSPHVVANAQSLEKKDPAVKSDPIKQ